MDARVGILAAAERVFRTHGFQGGAIDRIVSEANVTSRTLYRHFTSKDTLIGAVLESLSARFDLSYEKELIARVRCGEELCQAGSPAPLRLSLSLEEKPAMH